MVETQLMRTVILSIKENTYRIKAFCSKTDQMLKSVVHLFSTPPPIRKLSITSGWNLAFAVGNMFLGFNFESQYVVLKIYFLKNFTEVFPEIFIYLFKSRFIPTDTSKYICGFQNKKDLLSLRNLRSVFFQIFYFRIHIGDG